LICEYEDCREPEGKPAYVVEEDSGDTFCLFCYLVFKRGVDPQEASDIEFQGGKNGN
jgi:hypothetical protein